MLLSKTAIGRGRRRPYFYLFIPKPKAVTRQNLIGRFQPDDYRWQVVRWHVSNIFVVDGKKCFLHPSLEDHHDDDAIYVVW
jgi:hypothetical protein